MDSIAASGSTASVASEPRRPLTTMLLAVAFLPALVFFVRLGTSLAAGTAAAAAAILVLAMANPNRLAPWLAAGFAGYLAAAALILAHLVVAAAFHPIDVTHALTSLAPLLALVVGGSALAATIADSSRDRIDRAVMTVVWATFVLVLARQLGFVPPPANLYEKPVFPFSEPSHLVLAFMPFYLYACVATAPAKRAVLVAAGAVAILVLESLTLAVGLALILVVCLRGSLAIVALALVAVVAASTIHLDLAYFTDRLDFSGGSQNVSTLVWLQGWQLAGEALAATRQWGVGFQQLGLQGTNTAISRLLYILVGADANLFDGGFGAAKIVGEFGLIGLGMVAAVTIAAARSLVVLRRMAKHPGAAPRPALFAHAVVAGFLIELFVRGAGYFTGSGLLLLAAIQLRRSRPAAAPAWSVAQWSI